MKIAIFVSYTYPYIGSGIGNVARKQAEELAKNGHKVTLISSNFPASKKVFTKNKVKHIKLNSVYFLEKLHIPVPLCLLNVKAIHAIKKADIVHVHDAVYPTSLLAICTAKIYKKPVVLTQHIALIKYPSKLINFIQTIAYKTVAALSFKLSNKIIYFNPDVYKLINKYNKSAELPNGVDNQLFSPATPLEKTELRKKYKLPENKKIVLFVGRLVPKKGFNLLFETSSDDYFILFVGNGTVPEHMKDIANTRFVPGMPQEELSEMYKLSDIFVLPSTGEGFPLSIQEAMSSGLPILTSKCNIFDHSLDFIKTFELDSKDIKDTIQTVLNDAALTKQMGRLSSEYATKNYSWTENINKLTEIYKEIQR